MLKTQQSILAALQDLATTQRRTSQIQERLLQLEEYRVYGRVMTDTRTFEE